MTAVLQYRFCASEARARQPLLGSCIHCQWYQMQCDLVASQLTAGEVAQLAGGIGYAQQHHPSSCIACTYA